MEDRVGDRAERDAEERDGQLHRHADPAGPRRGLLVPDGPGGERDPEQERHADERVPAELRHLLQRQGDAEDPHQWHEREHRGQQARRPHEAEERRVQEDDEDEAVDRGTGDDARELAENLRADDRGDERDRSRLLGRELPRVDARKREAVGLSGH